MHIACTGHAHGVRTVPMVFAAFLALVLPVQAVARTYALKDSSGQTIFQSDDDIVVVRGLQKRENAHFEIIFADRDGRVQCISHEEDRTPLAAETVNMSYGYVSFEDLSVDDIARVSCRWRN